MLNGQSIFITGGTGTLGRAFIAKALRLFPTIKRIVIYSRDEMKQYDLRRQYPTAEFPQFQWVIGDVRDQERLTAKMKGADVVIHSAAMKHIPICEENPEECLKTNVEGTKHVIHAAIENEVKKTVLCSTDKAVDPISTYGNSKQAAEKLFLHASNENCTFAIIRFGNIWGSRGSVVPLFEEEKVKGVLPITHPDMTRFFCTEEQSANSIVYALQNMQQADIFIPKMRARKITDIAKEIAPNCTHKIIGLRGFEKMYEKLVSAIESEKVIEEKAYWVVRKHASESLKSHLSSADIQHLDSRAADEGFALKYHLN